MAKRKAKGKAAAEGRELTAVIEADVVLNDQAAYQALQCILEGQHEKDVLEMLVQEFPKVDRAKTLAAVMDHLAGLSHADPDAVRGWCLAALREVYNRAMQASSFQDAIRCIKELERMAAKNRPPQAEEPGP